MKQQLIHENIAPPCWHFCQLFTVSNCLQHSETTKPTKKEVQKTPKVRSDALKTAKETKSRKDGIRKSLKKRRQADRIACITLDEEVVAVDEQPVMPSSEQSASDPQADGEQAKSSISGDDARSKVGIPRWRKFQYVPFT